jgi:hypothetical protein
VKNAAYSSLKDFRSLAVLSELDEDDLFLLDCDVEELELVTVLWPQLCPRAK